MWSIKLKRSTQLITKSTKLGKKNTFITYVKFSGLSLISMIPMEISMNLVDFLLVGELKLTMEVIPIMLFFGFITPLPYNYWRLKVYGVSCH